jgi:serine/threonine-protein kinase
VDNRSDIYSLGVVMYEMIAGRVPYDGDSPVNIAIQHINGGAQKPSQYNPNIPQGLEQIIRKAMSLSPKDRYLTATAMLYDMDEFRKDPTMVFATESGGVDGATRAIPTELATELAAQQAKSIAERKVTEKSETMVVPSKSKPAPRPRRVEEDDEEEGRSRAATIAIASCVVVGIVAVIIFLVLLAQGGLFKQPDMVTVPRLIGENYDMLRHYDGIEVVRQGGEYSDDFARGEIISQYPLSGVKVVSGTKVFVKVSLGAEPPAKTMEDLVNLKVEEAEKFLDGLKLGLNFIRREENHPTIAAGYVTRTNPGEGKELSEGQTITIWVSTGPEEVFGTMLDVVGQTYDYAVTILAKNGFHNIQANPVDSNRPEGEVVGQSVAQYEEIDVTTEIILDVSNGNPPATPPDPTVPDVTEPESTEPDVTEPEPKPEQPVTMDFVFVVPSRTESYQLGIKLNDVWLLENQTVQPNTTTVSVSLTGSGVQNYDLYINGEYYATETVDFDPHD